MSIITVQIISIGVTSTTAVMLLVALLIISFILVVKCMNAHNEQKEHNQPIYEEVDPLAGSRQGPAAIELEINCSYGNIKMIKMTECPAYAQIETCSQHHE